jgi:hypothetical protein
MFPRACRQYIAACDAFGAAVRRAQANPEDAEAALTRQVTNHSRRVAYDDLMNLARNILISEGRCLVPPLREVA